MRLLKGAQTWLLVGLLAACGGAGQPVATTQPAATEAAMPSFRIVGYATDWDDSPDPTQIGRLTHINYAFLLPKPDGSITGIENPSKLEQIVEQAHARGVKALISVGGWGADADFEAMAANAEARAAFETNLERFALEHKLDGIDIDWEYPDPGVDSTRNYLKLMQELYAITRPRGWLLTSAVVAEGDTGAGIPGAVLLAPDRSAVPQTGRGEPRGHERGRPGILRHDGALQRNADHREEDRSGQAARLGCHDLGAGPRHERLDLAPRRDLRGLRPGSPALSRLAAKEDTRRQFNCRPNTRAISSLAHDDLTRLAANRGGRPTAVLTLRRSAVGRRQS
jgi:hypothetical protein